MAQTARSYRAVDIPTDRHHRGGVAAMRIVIVGAGAVGRSIAKNLAQAHDIVVIDEDPETVEDLTYSIDVLSMQGDGTEIATLRAAEVDRADLVIASTDSDETNVLICGAVKALSDAFTIARVRRRNILETWEVAEGTFNVDYMVCTELLAAQTICRIAGLPAAHDVNMFGDGLVRMAELEIPEGSSVAGRTVSEADQYDSLTFAAIFRDGELSVVTGESTMQANDRVVVIGSPEAVDQFAREIAKSDAKGTDDIVIVGASAIGFQVARELEADGYEPQLIEKDPVRAREVAEALPNTLVTEHDATDTEFLVREYVDESDVVVAALDSDEKNLLVSLLAEKIGVDRTIAIVENVEHADLFEAVAIDVAVNPREETAEEIVRFTRAERTEKIAMVEHDRAEVIQVQVDADSKLANERIVDVVADLPDGVVIGAITRKGALITPRGETVIEPNDRVVIFVDSEHLETVVEAL